MHSLSQTIAERTQLCVAFDLSRTLAFTGLCSENGLVSSIRRRLRPVELWKCFETVLSLLETHIAVAPSSSAWNKKPIK